MELFFVNSPIGLLTGIVKEKRLCSLSGQNQKALNASDLLACSSKKTNNKKNQLKSFKLSLKSLDTKKTYFFDPKKESPLRESPPSPLVQKIKKELRLFFQGELKSFNIPLCKRGSNFQQKVWKALQKIPYGHTKTYSGLAKLIQKPKAYRAVGSSCAKNPFLIVAPCHRVLSQKNLGGFALGLKTKKQLLNLERKNSSL